MNIFLALKKISELELNTPILPPLALCEGTLVFKEGSFVRSEIYQDVFNQTERQNIRIITEDHGITALDGQMKIDVVLVEGVEYIVDPLVDDNAEIDDYIFGRGNL